MESVVTVLTSLFLFTGGRHILKPTCEHDMLYCTLSSFPGMQKLLDRFTQRFNFHSVLIEWNRTP